jgi:hypothetical protein
MVKSVATFSRIHGTADSYRSWPKGSGRWFKRGTNVANGHANGLIVLSTPKGSLTLHLTGPEQKGFANLPDHFTFKITNSSGKYLGDAGTGTVVFVRDPAGTSATPEHGTFTMVFVS